MLGMNVQLPILPSAKSCSHHSTVREIPLVAQDRETLGRLRPPRTHRLKSLRSREGEDSWPPTLHFLRMGYYFLYLINNIP